MLDDLPEIYPSRDHLGLVGWINHSTVFVLATAGRRNRTRARPTPPLDPIRLRGDDLPGGLSRYRQRNSAHLSADHIPRMVFFEDAVR